MNLKFFFFLQVPDSAILECQTTVDLSGKDFTHPDADLRSRISDPS